MASASHVVSALHLGASRHLPSARRLRDQTPAEFRPLKDEIVRLQEELVQVMTEFLEKYPKAAQ